MLADLVEKITVDDLWSYQRHFYQRLSPGQEKQFAFEDLAGVYRDHSAVHYFSVCTRYTEIDGLKIIPAGTYLCADCTEENWQETLEKLMDIAKTEYHVRPSFSLQFVVISGILQWKYQLQFCIGV
jgi:hypothetical protein